MRLRDARVAFTKLICQLIMEMHDKGFRPAFGEGMDRKTAKDPTTDHMKGSLHEIGLAMDIDLYDDNGTYLSSGKEHAAFAMYWKSLHPFCRAGADFGDGNHYSFSDASIPGCVNANGQLRK